MSARWRTPSPLDSCPLLSRGGPLPSERELPSPSRKGRITNSHHCWLSSTLFLKPDLTHPRESATPVFPDLYPFSVVALPPLSPSQSSPVPLSQPHRDFPRVPVLRAVRSLLRSPFSPACGSRPAADQVCKSSPRRCIVSEDSRTPLQGINFFISGS